MLDLSNTRIELSMEIPLSTASAAIEEGMALEYIQENGTWRVTKAAATSNASFAGAALSYYTLVTTFNQVDYLTINAVSPYTVTLTQTPTAAADIVVQLSPVLYQGNYYAGTNLSYNSSPSSSQFSYGSAPYTTLTFNSANAGLIVACFYQYSPTVTQALTLTGDGVAGHTVASDVTGTLGVIQRGLIFTSMFDPTINWQPSSTAQMLSVTTASGGLFSTGGSPTVNAFMWQAPSADTPFLGLLLRG